MARIVELYSISATTGEEFRWNNQDRPIEYLSETYTPLPIRRSEFSQDKEINKSGIRISVPLNNPLIPLLISSAYDGVISVTVFRGVENVFSTHWKGKIVAISGISENSATIDCENLFASIRKSGSRARYQKQCRHVLYGSGCSVSKSSHQYEVNVSGVVGNTLFFESSAVLPSLQGGILEFAGEYRFISGRSGNTLTLWRRFKSLEDSLKGEVTTDPNLQITDWTHTGSSITLTTSGNHGISTGNPIRIDNLWYSYRDPAKGVSIDTVSYNAALEELTIQIRTTETPFHGLNVSDTIEIKDAEYVYFERTGNFLGFTFRNSSDLNGLHTVKEILSATTFVIDFQSEDIENFIWWRSSSDPRVVGSSDGLNPLRIETITIPYETYPTSVTSNTITLSYSIEPTVAIEDRIIEPNPTEGVDHPTVSVRNLLAGAVYVYPGCNRTIFDCNSTFNNIANYGGFPWIPVVNPFNPVSLW